MCITLFLRPGWGGGVRDLYLLEKICNIYKDRNTTKREGEREGERKGEREQMVDIKGLGERGDKKWCM